MRCRARRPPSRRWMTPRPSGTRSSPRPSDAKTLVVPGDRRETRDPRLSLHLRGSGMDPGSARLRRLSGMTPIF
ncbi:hypothetical protein BOS5A_200431 [Bosea sp. EC-HK365B]|nr:hypothetical protein BOSE7B_40836 [Bosea sp. 7B]VVT58129.1 hypothetical protein BOS5A_200431 [Bosea sp. EC-HK365B]VXC85328.1 hypothetical protein BOSE127_60235 [Bosea sp. 127]